MVTLKNSLLKKVFSLSITSDPKTKQSHGHTATLSLEALLYGWDVKQPANKQTLSMTCGCETKQYCSHTISFFLEGLLHPWLLTLKHNSIMATFKYSLAEGLLSPQFLAVQHNTNAWFSFFLFLSFLGCRYIIPMLGFLSFFFYPFWGAGRAAGCKGMDG